MHTPNPYHKFGDFGILLSFIFQKKKKNKRIFLLLPIRKMSEEEMIMQSILRYLAFVKCVCFHLSSADEPKSENYLFFSFNEDIIKLKNQRNHKQKCWRLLND